MNNMNIDEINTNLKVLWANLEKGVLAPIQYKEPIKADLVFVGMNPSFSEKGWKTLLRRIGKPTLEPREFLNWPSPLDFDIEISLKIEAFAKYNYPFFAPHRTLSTGLDLHWDHFDLFAYRETSQSKVRSLVLSECIGSA